MKGCYKVVLFQYPFNIGYLVLILRYIVAVFGLGILYADTQSRADFLQITQNRPSGG